MATQSDEHAEDEVVEVTRTGDDDVAHALVRGEHELELDEPDWIPIGEDSAPYPTNYLMVAAAGCQVEVIAQAFHKARIDDYEIRVSATADVDEGGEGPEPFPEHMAWRYTDINLELEVETTEEYESRVRRCLEVAEDACIVSRSIEEGINVPVSKRLVVKPTPGDD